MQATKGMHDPIKINRYMSLQIQNEIIKILHAGVEKKIVKIIANNNYYFILPNKGAGSLSKSILSLMLRSVRRFRN